MAKMNGAWTKRILAVAVVALLGCGLLSGCSSDNSSAQKQEEAPAAAELVLEGQALDIYCGAGMADPMAEIATAFTTETGCAMNVTYANAAQIQTQITTTNEGDFFIAGAADELKPVQDYVVSSTNLVKHIPVLIVPADNPANVNSLADLTPDKVSALLVGDPESTPIGKIAKKALTDADSWDALSAANVLTTTTTAPQIATAVASGEGQAGIVWKENAGVDGITIVDTPDMEKYIKVIPAAQLTCCDNEAAATAFNEFLQSDTVKDIWAKYGYEQVNSFE